MAINGMKVDAVGLDFFRVSLNALKDARLLRLIRMLESDSRTSSFWYLLQSNEKVVKRAAKVTGLDLVELKDIADRLRGIRDKTFVHIDKEGVFDPQKFYRAANLNNDKVAEIIRLMWATMRILHQDVFGKELAGDDYTGEDIQQLARLRDGSA